MGATWTGLVIGIVVLVLLLVFILQNLDSVTLEMFVWEFTLPLGVTLLFAAIAGAVIMAARGRCPHHPDPPGREPAAAPEQ